MHRHLLCGSSSRFVRHFCSSLLNGGGFGALVGGKGVVSVREDYTLNPSMQRMLLKRLSAACVFGVLIYIYGLDFVVFSIWRFFASFTHCVYLSQHCVVGQCALSYMSRTHNRG